MTTPPPIRPTPTRRKPSIGGTRPSTKCFWAGIMWPGTASPSPRRPQTGKGLSGSGQSQRDMLGFEEALHPLGAQFAAPAALFHSPKGSLAGSGQAVVDSHHAGFD